MFCRSLQKENDALISAKSYKTNYIFVSNLKPFCYQTSTEEFFYAYSGNFPSGLYFGPDLTGTSS